MKTLAGRVPVGTPFISGVPSQGEILVVMCPKCHQPLIEYCDSSNWDTYIETPDDPQPDTYVMGVVERGSYADTDRIYCMCGITTEVDPTVYCCSGQFAICWDPNADPNANGGGCATPVTDVPFNTNPPLEWFEVGVMSFADKVFVELDDGYHQATCLCCHKEATVTVSGC